MTKPSAQLDREIAQALATGATADGKQPLYNHTGPATAYLVADYPYGFRNRTQIRYWLENAPKKGWRLVSQTMNPATGSWNKPKASTYAAWGGAMYLDDNGHVQWEGIGPYSSDQKILEFVEAFPRAKSLLREVVPAKLRFLRKRLSGKIVFEVNGTAIPLGETDVQRLHSELALWEEIEARLAGSE